MNKSKRIFASNLERAWKVLISVDKLRDVDVDNERLTDNL